MKTVAAATDQPLTTNVLGTQRLQGPVGGLQQT